jgi:hypothetical protein
MIVESGRHEHGVPGPRPHTLQGNVRLFSWALGLIHRIRVTYIVLAHTGASQLCRLIERLDGDHARFLIHIDKRSPRSVYDATRRALGTNPHVTFLQRQSSRRTTFGLVGVPMNALSVLVREGSHFDYAILLTGQDYPVKSTEAILAHLEENRGACFLHSFPMGDPGLSDWPPTEVSRYRDWHFWIDGHHARIRLNRSIPGGLEPFGGSMYWGLPREAVLYITDFIERERQFVRFFRHTSTPDEMFFQTILMNSPLRDRVTTMSAPCCYGLHYIDWLPGQAHPETLGLSDLPRLRSTPALFARKFDSETDRKILDAIDDQLLEWRSS